MLLAGGLGVTLAIGNNLYPPCPCSRDESAVIIMIDSSEAGFSVGVPRKNVNGITYNIYKCFTDTRL